MHERGQEPVDEDQPVLRTCAHGPLPRPGRESGLKPLVPQQAYLGDEFSDHNGRQARDPPVADDRCRNLVPHHATMIDNSELDVSPPTCTSSSGVELVLDPVDGRLGHQPRFAGPLEADLGRVRTHSISLGRRVSVPW